MLLTAIADPASPLWVALRQFDGPVAGPSRYDAAALASWLNGLAQSQPSGGLHLSDEALLIEREYRCYRRRMMLESALPGVFRGGAAIEFSDNFRSMREILDATDPGIRGVVDLTVCNSVALGEEIRRKCPRCMVMVNAKRTSPAFRLALYRQAIHLMKTGGRSYPDTVMRLRQYLVDTVAQSYERSSPRGVSEA